MPRPRRRRGHWEVEIGRARIEPEPEREIDVQTGRAHDIRPVDETQLYDYGNPTPDPDDDVMEGGSLQTRDGHQFHEVMRFDRRRR